MTVPDKRLASRASVDKGAACGIKEDVLQAAAPNQDAARDEAERAHLGQRGVADGTSKQEAVRPKGGKH